MTIPDEAAPTARAAARHTPTPRMLAAVAAGTVYLLVVALLFRDLLPDIATHLYSYVGDPLLNASILEWSARHVPLSTGWWNFPSFAPLSGVTAFTEHLLVAYPLTTPIIWLTGNPVLAHNVLLLAAFPLNGLAAYLLAREVTGSPPAAFVGGLAFAFAPYQSTQVSHVQTLIAFGMPLGLLGLHRYVAGPIPDPRSPSTRPSLALFGIGWLIAALSNAYVLVFFPLLVMCWCAWFVPARQWRRLLPVVVTAVVFTLPVIPLLWGYHVRLSAYGLGRTMTEIDAFSADVVALAGISHRAWLWHGILPGAYEEAALFPGLTILLLAIVALRWSRGHQRERTPLRTAGSTDGTTWFRRDALMFYATAAVGFWLLALGPQPEWSESRRALAYGPYWVLMQLPAVDSIRVPARAWLPSVLCLSVLAAAGAARLASGSRRKQAAAVVLTSIAIVAEGWFSDVQVPAPEAMSRDLIPAGALVLDLPIEQGFWNAIPQYRAVRGGYRAVNGYSGYQPEYFEPTRHAIADLRPDALAPFQSVADLYVIVRPDTPAAVARWVAEHPGAERIHAGAGVDIFKLPRLHPEAPRRPLPLPLPRPGARPFGT
jgi:hypothetical protein